MDITESSLLVIWDLFVEYLPNAKKNELATRLVKVFTDQDIEISEFSDIRGEDEHLDYAFEFLEVDDDDFVDEEEY